MPDNWTFVAAAYGLAALVFGGYWLRLARRERDLAAVRPERQAVRTEREAVPDDRASRGRQPSETAHPRAEPGKGHPLQ